MISTLKEKYKFPFPPFDANDNFFLKSVQSFKFSSKFKKGNTERDCHEFRI